MRWVEASTVRTPADIARLLGVGLNCEGLVLLRAYHEALARDPSNHADLRLAYKIAEDPYYRLTFRTYGTLQAIAQAGFFDDGLEPGVLLGLMNPNWLVTPLDKLISQIDLLKKKPPAEAPRVVLLSTGCFAPVHEGHIAMMTAAWARLSQEGYAVLGGFLSSSHSAYVSTKGSSAAALNAGVRLRALNRALSPHDWLMADPWESLYVPAPLNFTDVIRRLEMYINRHITSHPPVTVAYVFGSDNADFAQAFVERGLGVCVERPGYEDGISRIKSDSRLASSGRILLTDPRHVGQYVPKVSSSAVRDGVHPQLTSIVKELADHQLEIDGARSDNFTLSARASLADTYLIRDDIRWGASLWENLCDRADLSDACERFTQKLMQVICASFERSQAPGYPAAVVPLLMPIDMQRAAAAQIEERFQVINNDVVTMAPDGGAGVSRLFSLSASQFSPGELVERPENIGALAKLSALKSGEYVLMDDDIATRTTMKALRALLPAHCSVLEEVALSKIAFEQSFPGRAYEFWDVVDARDFLLGARAAGLVVRLFNEQIARAPYLSPYVSLSSRANIPPSQERALSLAIIELNLEFFASLGASITLRQSAVPFQNLMAAAGFAPSDTMLAVCEWHRARLAC